jgi:hypothetical protein
VEEFEDPEGGGLIATWAEESEVRLGDAEDDACGIEVWEADDGWTRGREG